MQAEPAAVEPVETPEALMEVMEGMQPPHPSAMILMYLMRKLDSHLHEVEMEELGLMVRTRSKYGNHLDLGGGGGGGGGGSVTTKYTLSFDTNGAPPLPR